MPLEVTSVLPVTRPNPGKCLTVAATPPARMPARKAPTIVETRAGSLEYCRSYCPTGPLARPTEVGTVSATGARLTLMPARRSSAPQRVASAVRFEGEPWSWTRADGIRLKPSPRSCCTAPPSWSAARSSPRPAVSASDARPARWRVVVRTESLPPVQPPRRMTPPRWRPVTRASRLVRLVSLPSPTMSSCPARSLGLMRETMAGAHEDGAAGVPAVGVGPADDAGTEGVGAEGVEVVLELGGLVGSCVVEGCGVAVVEEARGLGPEVQAAASEVAAATRTA